MEIVDLVEGPRVEEIARIVVAGFGGVSWPDLESALVEVRESLADDRVSRVALDASGYAIGWIGGIEQYNGHVWELHPLVVIPELQGNGTGAALVADFERCVVRRGGATVTLGTDDETNSTSLSQTDLYPDVTPHIREIRSLKRHPYEFYLKQGYVIVGVIPDANGPGKPDILMAKRVRA